MLQLTKQQKYVLLVLAILIITAAVLLGVFWDKVKPNRHHKAAAKKDTFTDSEEDFEDSEEGFEGSEDSDE